MVIKLRHLYFRAVFTALKKEEENDHIYARRAISGYTTYVWGLLCIINLLGK